MKIQDRLFTSSVIALLLVAAGAAAPAAPDGDPVGNESTTVSSAGPEGALKWAMAADTVRQIMGQPDKITPMKAPNGKAEVWIFTRQLSQHVDRVAIGAIPIMEATSTVVGSCYDKKPGPTGRQKIGETIVYQDLFIATVETVELLMFNEHYVTHKISRENVRHYN